VLAAIAVLGIAAGPPRLKPLFCATIRAKGRDEFLGAGCIPLGKGRKGIEVLTLIGRRISDMI